MLRHLLVSLCLALLCLTSLQAEEAPRLVGARYPSPSPDGARLAFCYQGDLWMVASEGGVAQRLTSHDGYDRQPHWSPDGRSLTFTSTREGQSDVYLIASEGGEAKRLTWHSDGDLALDFTPDGAEVLFASGRVGGPALFRVPVTGGNPTRLFQAHRTKVYHAAYGPAGSPLIMSFGSENRAWWRRGYRGSNSAKIWLADSSVAPITSARMPRRLFAEEANAHWADWGSRGERVYFVSDRAHGTKNVWSVDRSGGDLRAVTAYESGDVTWLSLSADSRVAAFERDFKLWRLDLDSGEARALSIAAASERRDDRRRFVKNASVESYRLAPDGKKLAAVVRGEIFVCSKDGGYARNITNSPWREGQIDWDGESRRVVYVSDQDGKKELYIRAASGEGDATRLTDTPEEERAPRFSPDGKWLCYLRGRTQLRLMKADGTEDRLLREGAYGSGPVWAPDSRLLALSLYREGQDDLVAVDVTTGEQTLLTDTAYSERSPYWSKDGKTLLFASNRSGHSFPEFRGKWDIYRLLLQPKPDDFGEDRFEKLFEPKKKDEPKSKATPSKKSRKKPKAKPKPVPPVRLELRDIAAQTTAVTATPGNESRAVLSPKDNKTVYLVSDFDGSRKLWRTSLPTKRRAAITSFASGLSSPSQLQFDAEGRSLYYLRSGRVGRIDTATGKTRSISFETRIELDKVTDYEQMLAEVYSTLKHNYYDATMNGVDWDALYAQHRAVLSEIREDRDFYDVMNRMIGHLNSSHTGGRGPSTGGAIETSAHLGCEWRVEGDRYVVTRVLDKSPVALLAAPLQIGDELRAIDGVALDTQVNLWRRLAGRVGKRVLLRVKRKGSSKFQVLKVKGLSSSSERRLRYEEWVADRKAYVRARSKDRLAYIYMPAMGSGDLSRFLKELERDAAPREGLILDLRDNNGGNVHDRVLDALTRPLYARWKRRGLSATRQSTFGFSDKRVVLLINEQTLSDGEMTANGFKELRRGPVIGETTYGWIIFTTSRRLLNGGSFRLPFWGCYSLDGRDLERDGGVKPNIYVPQDLRDELAGEDPQLDAALKRLLPGLY